MTSTPPGGEQPDPRHNAVLGRLPADEYERVLAKLQPEDTEIKQRIYDLGGYIQEIYFPVDAVFSLTNSVGGSDIEVATVGNEAMVGLSVYLGAETSPTDTFCQIPGRSLRMAVPDLHTALAQSDRLSRLLGMTAQAQIIQLSQNVACNRLHNADQRAARWMLMSHDRAERDQFPLTQQFLAEMLGLRRPTVTETARDLQNHGLIRYSRGKLTILDRPGLETTACECYRVIHDQTAQLLDREATN